MSFERSCLVVQNDIEQRTVDLQSAFDTAGVVNKAQFPEPVHEKADSRTSGSDHFCQRLLTYLGDHGLGNAFLAEMSEQRRTRASRFSLELNNWSTRSSS